MSCGLVHASYSLPELQAVKLTFFAPLVGPIFFSSLSGRIKVSNNFTSETSVFVKLSIKSENFVVCRSFSRISSLKKGDFCECLWSLSRLRNDQLGKRSTFFSYCVFLRACVLNWLLIKPQPTASKSGNYATSVNNIVSFLFSVKWWLECCANDQSGKAWLLLCAFTSATKTSRYRQV